MTVIAKNTMFMAFSTILSRGTGLLRTWAMAFALGTGLIASAYNISNGLPNVIYDFVAGGIISTAFVPIYIQLKELSSREEANNYASSMLNIVIIVLGGISLLATFFAPAVVATQTFSLNPDDPVISLSVTFFRVFAVQVVFYGLSGIISGILNAHKVYGWPAIVPAFNNIVTAVSLFLFVPLSQFDMNLAIFVVAVGTTIGVAVQFFIQIPYLIKIGFKWRFKINFKGGALRESFKIAVPTCVYILGMLIVFSFRNSMALSTGGDGPAVLSYAWMWFQLPYGVIAVSLSTILLTELGFSFTNKNMVLFKFHIDRGLKWTFLLMLFCGVAMFVLSHELVSLLQVGAFNNESVQLCSNILLFWIIGLPFYAGQMFFYRVFAVLKKFSSFAILSTILCVVQALLYIILCPIVGLIGIPIADIVYYLLMFVIGACLLKKEIGKFTSCFVSFLFKAFLSGFSCLIILFTIKYFFYIDSESLFLTIIYILLLSIIGIVSFFGTAKLLRIKEVSEIYDSLLQKKNH